MDDGLKNLIFLVVALLAWGIKAAMERKQSGRRGRRPRPASTPGEEEAAGSTGEVDVVYGRRGLSPQITAQPIHDVSAPLPPVAQSAPNAAVLQSDRAGSGGGGRLTQIGERGLKTSLKDSGREAANEGASVHRSRRAWKRLGVEHGGQARRALRTAVIWSEVLGPPRALRGPHRPPRSRTRT